jgi:predicted short-subunit dehydrogenase-like oxidoreductase (DUF2520 family)
MGSRPTIGVVGAGHVGTALAVALTRAGWDVRAVASRDPDRRAAVGARLPGVRVVTRSAEAAAAADVVLLAVPDDVIVEVGGAVLARPGQLIVHTSGVHPAAILRPALPSGVAVGAFHPLVAFADVERAVEALRGARVVIDGDPEAVETLETLAAGLGARPVVLAYATSPADALTGPADAATAKAAHHAAAVLAAGGFVALLDAIVALGAVAGLDEATALDVYASLVRQGLANAATLGVADALTGPVLRGDAGTVRRHLEAIERAAPDVRDLYLAAARRQLAIARQRGAIDTAQDAELVALLSSGSSDPRPA